jgi:hypothetical protein
MSVRTLGKRVNKLEKAEAEQKQRRTATAVYLPQIDDRSHARRTQGEDGQSVPRSRISGFGYWAVWVIPHRTQILDQKMAGPHTERRKFAGYEVAPPARIYE